MCTRIVRMEGTGRTGKDTDCPETPRLRIILRVIGYRLKTIETADEVISISTVQMVDYRGHRSNVPSVTWVRTDSPTEGPSPPHPYPSHRTPENGFRPLCPSEKLRSHNSEGTSRNIKVSKITSRGLPSQEPTEKGTK